MTDNTSVTEFFEIIVGKHPSKVSKEKFDKIISLYEDVHDKVEFFSETVDNRCVVRYICPVTGEVIRERSATKHELEKFDVFKTSAVKLIDEISLLDEVDELRTNYSGYKTLVDANTVEMLSKMDKYKSEVMHMLIENLVAGNAGVITLSCDKEYKRFLRVFKQLKDDYLVKPVENKLKKSKHFSYRIAPYIAYKGSQSNRESVTQSWFREEAKSRAESIVTGHEEDGTERKNFPVEPPFSCREKEIVTKPA